MPWRQLRVSRQRSCASASTPRISERGFALRRIIRDVHGNERLKRRSETRDRRRDWRSIRRRLRQSMLKQKRHSGFPGICVRQRSRAYALGGARAGLQFRKNLAIDCAFELSLWRSGGQRLYLNINRFNIECREINRPH